MRKFVILLVAFVVLNALDAVLTVGVVSRAGLDSEINPLLRYYVLSEGFDNFYRHKFTFCALATLGFIYFHRVEQKKEQVERVLLVIDALMFLTAIINSAAFISIA